MPVGIYALDEASFTIKSIQLISNDIVYVFSDGFADQFGGPDNKKFKYKAFKSLLLEIYKKDLHTQKTMLYNAFNKWKGNEQQVDDILIAGIKFL